MISLRRTGILFSSLLLTLTLCAVPWWVGNRIRPAMVDAVHARLPESAAQQLTITELDYEQGIFTSKAHYKVSIHTPDSTPIASFEVRADIRHGPVLIGDAITLGAASMQLSPLSESGSENASLDLELLVGFDQSVTLELTASPFMENDGSSEIALAGANATLLLRDNQSAAFNLDMKGLSLRDLSQGMELHVDGVHIESQTQQLNNPAAPASFELRIPAISSAGATVFSVTDFQTGAELSLTPDRDARINFAQHLHISELDSDWPLQSLDWEFKFEQLPAALVQDVYVMAAQLQARIEGGQPVDAAFIQSGFLLAIRLLNTDFQLHHTVQAQAYGGGHESALNISYNGLPALTDIMQLDLNELIAALNVELNLRFDLDAVLQSPAAGLIDPYAQQGYITLDNGQIQLQSTLRNSELILNGEPISIEQFF